MTSSKGSIPFARTDSLAQAVSLVFHPLIVVIPTMFVVMVQLGTSVWQSIFWAVLSASVANLPLGFLISYGVRSEHYSDIWVSIREQRRSVYLVYSVSMAILLAILLFGKAPIILTACWVSAMLTTAIGYLINHRFTKLSLHSVATAGCITVLCLTIPWLGLITIPLAPLVGWARIRLKYHTPIQILVGWAVSAICVIVVFWAFHIRF